jgi:hypothetical protein
LPQRRTVSQATISQVTISQVTISQVMSEAPKLPGDTIEPAQ